MKSNSLVMAFLSVFILTTHAQNTLPTQKVRGKVMDNETQFPLPGVKIMLVSADSLYKFRGITDVDGYFEIPAVTVGKYSVQYMLATYDNRLATIEVSSGKETVLEVFLQESFIEKEEMQVTARKKGQTINELAVVSSQEFSVEETNRYPGSRMDPARMASNFAGVQGADDSRNDIIIRGNSPLGVVWKVEGIDIPNPSHFATSGSTGGPVSILNNKMLANSDFLMSAFPAEYGNTISGVFDLNLRNGNNQQHEMTGQFGFLGTELLLEGPLNREKRSNYLFLGRYSTLSIFQQLGIQIGTNAVPQYGDIGFKFNWPLKNGGQLSWYGIGGKSEIDIVISNQKELTNEVYGEGDRDQYFGTSMGSTGLVYKKNLNEKTFVQSTLALQYDEQHSRHDFLIRSLDTTNNNGQQQVAIRVDSIFPLMGYDFRTTRLSHFFSVNHKINTRHLIKAGLNTDFLYFDQLDTVLDPSFTQFVKRFDYQGSAVLVQPFVQWKWKAKENMDVTAGIHSQYFSLSNSVSWIEPRLGWKYRLRNNQSVFAGAGLHSQTQPYYIYNYHLTDSLGKKIYHLQDMDFSRSFHSALGYEKTFKKNLNIRTEVYYQYLYNIPVEVQPSAFSMINMGSGFQRFFPDSVKNTGTGYNYGLELTVQKFFDRSFFFLFSGSVYDSKYRGSDGVLRNTSYNSVYTVNLLGGKEFKVGKRSILGLGTKVTTAGGRRYGFVDIDATKQQNELVFRDSAFNERQFREYFRLDLKVSWRMNADKVTHEIGLDLVNILNTQNILALAYAPNLADPSAEPIAERYQLGFLPIFYYKIDFRLSGKKKE